MALNLLWEPLPHCIKLMCNITSIPFRFRQKLRHIQSLIIEAQQMSNNNYKLYIFEDGCSLIDPLNNKLLCYYQFIDPVPVFMVQLENLWQFWRYEKNYCKCKSRSEVNFYLTQKQKYYG